MSKKDLKTGVEALLGSARPVSPIEENLSPETRALIAENRAKGVEKRRPGRPKKEGIEEELYFRTTIIAHRENYEKLKVIAMKLGRSFKEVINDALSAAVETYEERNGEVVLRDMDHENPFK